MRHEIAWPIDGAKTAVLVPARIEKNDLVVMTRAAKATTPVTRETITATTRKLATQKLASLQPEYVRNARGAIDYAIIRSPDPFTPALTLSPAFGDLFKDTLGPDILVAIPHRNMLVAIPATGTPLNTAAELVALEYRAASHPVTKEIFAWRKGNLRAIGRFP